MRGMEGEILPTARMVAMIAVFEGLYYLYWSLSWRDGKREEVKETWGCMTMRGNQFWLANF